MKRYTFSILWALALFSFLLTGCNSEEVAPANPTSYLKLAEGQSSNAAVKVELFGTEELTTGYNRLYLSLTDAAGKRLEKASINLLPMMQMMDKAHAAPAENPASEQAVDGYFPGAVVFTMPSGQMGSWVLTVTVQGDGQTEKIDIPMTVKEPAVSRLKSFVSQTDGAKYFVAYLQPRHPKVGVNDLEVAVYRMDSMTDFQAEGNLTMELTPEMPTMGHGSPNNVSPVHSAGGHYKGKVNFTMTGLWYLHLSLQDGAEEAGKVYFEVSF